MKREIQKFKSPRGYLLVAYRVTVNGSKGWYGGIDLTQYEKHGDEAFTCGSRYYFDHDIELLGELVT